MANLNSFALNGVFELYVPLLLHVEGGYQNMAGDSGNYNSLGQRVGTNHGISAKAYEAWIKRPPTVADMKAITEELALTIYRAWYWDKMKADRIDDQNVANIIVDHAVNAGPGAAGILLQQSLNEAFGKRLVVDGIIGNQTLAAVNSVNGQLLFEKIKSERADYYNAIGGQYLAGWLLRLNAFVYQKKKK